MHLRCPHCQNPIELADLPSAGEITCAGCGSSFNLDNFSTATWDGPQNKRIGKFEVLEKVGHGAFGTVSKARDAELDRIVAIKVPRPGNVGTSQEDLDRFLREARAVAQLRFPSIISIHEVGTDNGVPYLVTDFVEGITLADHLSGRGFTFAESAKLIAEVADALQYAHSLGVVHRDVKPSNIMIRPDGSPCVMDFGLAKRDAGEITMTIDGQILGTPAYMSPEQARGDAHQVDGRSDVYSLGVILYQLLTRELPFRGNKAMLLHQVLNDEPAAPRTLNNKIPRDLETIALKAMAKEPGRRYATAKALADDLRRWFAGQPIVARPVGVVERTWQWAKRKPALAAANAVVVIALIAVSSLLFVVKRSLDQEEIEREKAVKLAGEKQTLANKNKKLADDADARREKAEELTAQVRFNHFLSLANDNTPLAVVGMAQQLPDASRLKNPRLLESMRLHLGGWAPEVNKHPLRWVGAHAGRVIRVALSADGKIAVSGSSDKTARLWDVATGKPMSPPLEHQDAVIAVALSANGKIALTGSSDKTARLWDIATGKSIGPPLEYHYGISAVALSADGKVAVTVGSIDTMARLWDGATGKAIGMPLRHKGRINCVAIDADGNVALTGSSDKTAQLWDAASGKPIGPPLQHQGRVDTVALSSDGKTALTRSDDHTAQLWDAASGKPLGPPLQRVGAVALSADGKTALTGSKDNTARLWDATTGKPIGAPLQHQGEVVAVALSANGKTALTGSKDNTARLWDATTGKPIGPPLQHQNGVHAATLCADGKTALTASNGTTAQLWDAATGKPIGAPLQHQRGVTCVALSADGRTALTGSLDTTARLWEGATGKPIGPPLQHQFAVLDVALSADGKTALTPERTARLWNLPRFADDPERIALWAQVITGIESDEHGNGRALDAATWQQRREQLQKLGGPPILE